MEVGGRAACGQKEFELCPLRILSSGFLFHCPPFTDVYLCYLLSVIFLFVSSRLLSILYSEEISSQEFF